jgi:hypothetical protein
MFGGWNGDVLKFRDDSFSCLWKLSSTYSGYVWEKIKPINTYDMNITLLNKRGHTSNIIGNDIYLFGGIEGFNRYTNDLVSINVEVSN